MIIKEDYDIMIISLYPIISMMYQFNFIQDNVLPPTAEIVYEVYSKCT